MERRQRTKPTKQKIREQRNKDERNPFSFSWFLPIRSLTCLCRSLDAPAYFVFFLVFVVAASAATVCVPSLSTREAAVALVGAIRTAPCWRWYWQRLSSSDFPALNLLSLFFIPIAFFFLEGLDSPSRCPFQFLCEPFSAFQSFPEGVLALFTGFPFRFLFSSC